MKSVLKKLFAPVALALALTGCAENPQDIAARPAIVDAMVQNSLDICQTGLVNADKAAYETRLRTVLNDVGRTSSLKEMQNHNLTVCLDQRLVHQNLGFWDQHVKAVMYRDGDKGGIVSLYDDGRAPGEVGFWSAKPSAYSWGARDISRLAAKFQDGKISEKDNLMYAARESCGKHCSDIYWRTPASFDKDTQAKNPELAKPPVPLPVQKPAS
ncbi:MAG: hypothetical protein EPN97_12195 [Alphaproteobacteria bacterium]|nr:MAG: hypothetical protein EPN97_12195 [Alphaproteobacteria bacterium]